MTKLDKKEIIINNLESLKIVIDSESDMYHVLFNTVIDGKERGIFARELFPRLRDISNKETFRLNGGIDKIVYETNNAVLYGLENDAFFESSKKDIETRRNLIFTNTEFAGECPIINTEKENMDLFAFTKLSRIAEHKQVPFVYTYNTVFECGFVENDPEFPLIHYYKPAVNVDLVPDTFTKISESVDVSYLLNAYENEDYLLTVRAYYDEFISGDNSNKTVLYVMTDADEGSVLESEIYRKISDLNQEYMDNMNAYMGSIGQGAVPRLPKVIVLPRISPLDKETLFNSVSVILDTRSWYDLYNDALLALKYNKLLVTLASDLVNDMELENPEKYGVYVVDYDLAYDYNKQDYINRYRIPRYKELRTVLRETYQKAYDFVTCENTNVFVNEKYNLDTRIDELIQVIVTRRDNKITTELKYNENIDNLINILKTSTPQELGLYMREPDKYDPSGLLQSILLALQETK